MADTLAEAREASEFMLVAVNDSWKILVLCFSINHLASNAELINKYLEYIDEREITLIQLTSK